MQRIEAAARELAADLSGRHGEAARRKALIDYLGRIHATQQAAARFLTPKAAEIAAALRESLNGTGLPADLRGNHYAARITRQRIRTTRIR